MSQEPSQEFSVCASLRRKSQAEKLVEKEGCFGLSLTVSLYCDFYVLLSTASFIISSINKNAHVDYTRVLSPG
jgi:hypothetical protein